MNANSLSGSEGLARAVVRDQASLSEARLWDRARANLMLLYGGRRGCPGYGQATVNRSGVSPFDFADADI